MDNDNNDDFKYQDDLQLEIISYEESPKNSDVDFLIRHQILEQLGDKNIFVPVKVLN